MSMTFAQTRVLIAPVAASASGANIVIAVPAGQRVLVYSYVLVASGTVTAQWNSGATALSGALALTAAQGAVSVGGSQDVPVLVTAASGDDLVLTLGGATAVNGHVAYSVVAA